MHPTDRREAAPLIDRLLAAPQEFEFVQAVRILLGWLAGQGVPAGEALQTHLRFANSLRLGFPASEVESLARFHPPGAMAGDEGGLAGFTLTPGFMGLLGVHGALPAQVTERIAAWQASHDDEAPRAFLDLLSGRMLALFYRAWHKHRIEHEELGQPLLLALAGIPDGGRASGGGVLPDTLFAHFAGLLQQRPVCAVVLERVLASYFGELVRLEEAVGHWAVLDAGEQPALGVNARLGDNTLLGERSWRPDLRARLRIGPLDRDAFAGFLPGGARAEALRAILALVAEPTVGFEVQLVLRASDVGPSRLAGGAAVPSSLGRDSFLLGSGGEPARADRADMRYLLQAMAPLAPLPGRSR